MINLSHINNYFRVNVSAQIDPYPPAPAAVACNRSFPKEPGLMICLPVKTTGLKMIKAI
jgi:hypothetical protein